MNRFKRIIAIILSAIFVIGLSACAERVEVSNNISYNLDVNIAKKSAGKIVWLGYYDLNDKSMDEYELVQLFKEKYDGEIVSKLTTYDMYFETLSSAILSNDSPDITKFESRSYPHGIIKQQYEALDKYIDLDSDIWSGVKDVASQFIYKDKLYYVPIRVTPSYVLFYNATEVRNSRLEDPYDLYLRGDWTWDTFQSLVKEWVDLGDDRIGYCGTGALSFLNTTGTKLIDVSTDGTITNNLDTVNVRKAQSFLNGMSEQNLISGVYAHPSTAFLQGKQLFYASQLMGSYELIARSVPEDTFRFVPFPKAEDADKYYQAFDTYGYMVPKGAKNISGAIDWIMFNRIEEVGAQKTQKQKAMNPEKQYYTKGANAGKEKWVFKWEENMYDLSQDLINPDKFSLVYDNAYGFNDELSALFDELGFLNLPILIDGKKNMVKGEYLNSVNSILDEYR